MGAGLVQRALLEPIDDDAKTVLCAMALTALDTPQNGHTPGIYWGGHDYLITVIRPGIKPDTAEWKAAGQSVTRRVRRLIQAGCIEVVRRAAPGRPAHYRVLQTPISRPPDRPVDNHVDSP